MNKLETIARAERIIELRSQRKSYEEIGREFNITRERVRQILRMYAPWSTGTEYSPPHVISFDTRKCPVCGKSFNVRSGLTKKYCSKVCATVSMRKLPVFIENPGMNSRSAEYRHAIYEYNKKHRPHLIRERQERSHAVHQRKYQTDPEYRKRVIKYQQDYQNNHRELVRARARARYWKNPEVFRAQYRAYYQKNKKAVEKPH